MQYYFAPLEGITGYLYRNTFQRFFGENDRYFAPFITPTRTCNFKSKELNDLIGEHNQGIALTPQLLTNNANDFLYFTGKLREMGYEEVNLNLGCPSRTVVTKHRGSGFLEDPNALDAFFEAVFAQTQVRISVKTRIGLDEPEEFEALLEIYNRYPLTELIIHPRLQIDYYKNHPNLEVFRLAVEKCVHPLCYNGDLFTVADVERFCQQFPSVERVMLGRGVIANPALFRELRGGKPLNKQELRAYHEALLETHGAVLYGERPLLFKMKEFWHYMICVFDNAEKYAKRIRKAQRVSDLQTVIADLFRDCELKEERRYIPEGGSR